MGRFVLGSTSITRLHGVHPLLVGVVVRAIQITAVDFTVYEGVRSLDRQKYLVQHGKSTTMNSRHLVGKAVDLPSWHGYPKWDKLDAQHIANAMMQSGKDCGVQLRWGGDWDRDGDQSDENYRDLVHFELPEDVYG